VGAHPRVETSTPELSNGQSAGAWRLKIDYDAFSQSTRCRLASGNGRAVYTGQAIGFRFKGRIDAAQTVFRIDGGPPMLWRDQWPELAQLRVAVEGAQLARFGDGIIRLPESLLGSASQVRIAPYRHARPHVFDLTGFAVLRDAARAQGCPERGWLTR
jgi:hypothetical protein